MAQRIHHRFNATWAISAALLLAIGVGCNEGQLPVALVEGKVFYLDEPLHFGGVMFQPDDGPPARGKIQPDGTFRLSTYASDDGAVIGEHRVRITCYESQRPGAGQHIGDDAPGNESHIPEKYTLFPTSGFTVTVKENNEPFVFKLK